MPLKRRRPSFFPRSVTDFGDACSFQILYDMTSFMGLTYSVEEKISSGSFGVVLRVKREDPACPLLAAKVFEEEEWTSMSDSEEETTMSPTSLRELSFMQLVSKLEAPNTVRVLDFDFSVGDYLALVIYMPLYMEDLSSAIDSERLDAKARFAVSCDVIRALQFLHSCRPAISHRDIKPENVLLDLHDRGCLTDFSFACFSSTEPIPYVSPKKRNKKKRRRTARQVSESPPGSSDPRHSGIIGTATYIAPEILSGAFPHPSGDAWALGVLLLELYDNDRLAADTDEDALKILRKERSRLDKRFLLQRIIAGFLKEDPVERLTVPSAAESLMLAGILEGGGGGHPAGTPSCGFEIPSIEISQETQDICRKLKTVVRETPVAAEVYRTSAPDMDRRVLAIIAAKMYEHRPRSDEGMALDLGVDVEALENGQEDLLRRRSGNLLIQIVQEAPLPSTPLHKSH